VFTFFLSSRLFITSHELLNGVFDKSIQFILDHEDLSQVSVYCSSFQTHYSSKGTIHKYQILSRGKFCYFCHLYFFGMWDFVILSIHNYEDLYIKKILFLAILIPSVVITIHPPLSDNLERLQQKDCLKIYEKGDRTFAVFFYVSS
jgi:hypothetical protein